VGVKLVIFKEDGNRRDIPVKPGTYVVGRNEGATIRIPLPSVSRAHCELVVTDDGARVRDLGSSNGTYQNYSRVKEADLGPGDVLGVGDCLLTIQINGQPADIGKPEPPIGGPSSDSSMMDTPVPGAVGGGKDDSAVTQMTGPGDAAGGAASDDVDLSDGIASDLGLDDSGEESFFDLDFLDDDDKDAPKL
jgi:predicted component of type VI protein secretion system